MAKSIASNVKLNKTIAKWDKPKDQRVSIYRTNLSLREKADIFSLEKMRSYSYIDQTVSQKNRQFIEKNFE